MVLFGLMASRGTADRAGNKAHWKKQEAAAGAQSPLSVFMA